MSASHFSHRRTLKNSTGFALACVLIGCSDSIEFDAISELADPVLSNAITLKSMPQMVRSNITLTDLSFNAGPSVLSIEPAQYPGNPAFVVSISGDAEDHPIVFNDAGLNGDALADDGVYSTVLHPDDVTEELVDVLESQAGHSTPRFEGFEKTGFTQHVKLNDGSFEANGPIQGNPDNIDPFRELIITDLAVIQDSTRTFNACSKQGTPDGEWTFEKLFTNIANQTRTGIDPGELARVWVDQIVNPTMVNGQKVTTTHLERGVFNRWITQSGGEGQPLDLSIAPFKLDAIVNRIDLRDGKSAGEVRFVFGALRLGRCVYEISAGPAPFSLIMEFDKPGQSYAIRKSWGRQWHKLASYDLGSEEYNRELEILTRTVTDIGSDPSQEPNHSALKHIRTNAEVSEGVVWQLREFRIAENKSAMRGYITHETLTTTPVATFNRTDALSEYMNRNAEKISNNKHQVPRVSAQNNEPMAAGSTRAGAPGRSDESFWQGSTAITVDGNTRHAFSINTCDGCHSRETETVFVHIDPERGIGHKAELSRFMSGIDVVDPVDLTTVRRFSELERRAQDLDALINLPRALQALRRVESSH